MSNVKVTLKARVSRRTFGKAAFELSLFLLLMEKEKVLVGGILKTLVASTLHLQVLRAFFMITPRNICSPHSTQISQLHRNGHVTKSRILTTTTSK